MPVPWHDAEDLAAKDGFERDAKERNVAPGMTNSNPRGKSLQLQFTVDDRGVFTTPWTATMTYGFSSDDWVEQVCAETIYWYSGRKADVPRANAGFLKRRRPRCS